LLSSFTGTCCLFSVCLLRTISIFPVWLGQSFANRVVAPRSITRPTTRKATKRYAPTIRRYHSVRRRYAPVRRVVRRQAPMQPRPAMPMTLNQAIYGS
jgi:hypothetical protein